MQQSDFKEAHFAPAVAERASWPDRVDPTELVRRDTLARRQCVEHMEYPDA